MRADRLDVLQQLVWAHEHGPEEARRATFHFVDQHRKQIQV